LKLKLSVSAFLLFLFWVLSAVSVLAKELNFAEIERESVDTVVFENNFVRVIKNASFHTMDDSVIFGKRMVVALAGLKCKTRDGIKTLQRGAIAVFLPGEPFEIRSGECFIVGFKRQHPVPKGPEVWLEPQKNVIVYEDELFRVFEERLAPGDTRELHSHSQRLVVRLNNVQLTDPRFKPNGAPGEGIQVPNTVKFAEPMVHVVKNLSVDTPLFNIIIEFKSATYINRNN
jgi:hypothetical protein